jgi:hypothetical protein
MDVYIKDKMRGPKFKKETLFVKAVGAVRHIDVDTGLPVMNMMFVGRDDNLEVKPEGEIISYHSHYINELKLGTLEAMDVKTAKLAGVAYKG